MTKVIPPSVETDGCEPGFYLIGIHSADGRAGPPSMLTVPIARIPFPFTSINVVFRTSVWTCAAADRIQFIDREVTHSACHC